MYKYLLILFTFIVFLEDIFAQTYSFDDEELETIMESVATRSNKSNIIDRIENTQVVLELSPREYITCPKKIFPDNIQEGDVLNITVTIDQSERSLREEEARKMQEQLLKRHQK